SFASPTLWQNLADYCIKNKIKLDSLKKILMAGAPVPAKLHRELKEIISEDAETLVPYGATEALPIANFTGSEMLLETADLTRRAKGYCVGYPFEECEIRIIKPETGKINDISETKQLKTYEIGEIIVKGPVVTKAYYGLQDATEFAKIADKKKGQLWHRMGDMGYFDEKGRLWFCGRKNHIVNTKNGIIYPAAMEAPFNIAIGRRTAIVGYSKNGEEIAILVVEGKYSPNELKEIREKALKIAEELNIDLRFSQIQIMKKFPVDIRHNAKISREKIREYISKINMNF
ncbi:MAG TPA: AMP-binding protein, partial [Victivallales bacterium]|nr:AMP-binding protein [Victivallales bacterium]